jgi:hypothetical protein
MIMVRQPATRAEFVLFDVFYSPTVSEVGLFLTGRRRMRQPTGYGRFARCGRYPLRNRGTAT